MKERDLYNPDTVDTVGSDSPSNRRRLNFSDIGKYLPRKLVRYAAPAAMAVYAAVYGGAVCGEEESHDDGVLGVSSGQRFNPEAFLKVPMPRDPDAQVVQGWKYNVVIRGTRSHFGIDYVLGVDINDADTWNPFPVLAAAQGVGCVGYYTDSEHGEGNYVQLLHPNGYRTRYLHNEEGSLSDRPYPDCSRPSKEWLPLRQGDKLSEAGDAGTEEDWTHLHWEVFDPAGNKIDPYDLYSTRTEYPDPNFLNGKKCGPKTLIVNCPIDTSNAVLAPTMAPRPTMEPFDAYTVSPPMEPIVAQTVSPPMERMVTPVPVRDRSERLLELDPYNPAQRAEWAILAKEISYKMAWEFVNYLSSGTAADLQAAYNMQVPEYLEFGRFNEVGLYSHKAELGFLQKCSEEMDAGQTYDISVNWPITGGVPKSLPEEMYLNYRQGYQRERFTIHVGFVHNRTDAHGRRLGFKRFSADTGASDPYIIFEVVGSRVYIAEPRFCTYELSPLNN